ncbi:hypothetical protein PROFUN_12900 [Planoprotostelium fungivorum]|uniref:Uncharacterized protein n=1 Tax=Planoprotostelium fungivorum TaxID=1890364 RepID=A0A2P6MWL8_9EUKA|nr:hypothetical protein PROFUN_12900 [Planoprotostelium fungivorum]
MSQQKTSVKNKRSEKSAEEPSKKRVKYSDDEDEAPTKEKPKVAPMKKASIPTKVKAVVEQGVSSNWQKLQQQMKQASPAKKGKPHKKGEQKDVARKLLEDNLKKKVEQRAAAVEEEKKKKKNTDNRPTKKMGVAYRSQGEGKERIITEVAIVNSFGNLVYHNQVDPPAGSRLAGNKNNFGAVQKEFSTITRDKIMIGYKLEDLMKSFFMTHPKKFQRDLVRYYLFKEEDKTSFPLERIIKEQTTMDIKPDDLEQEAHACLSVYNKHKKEWEAATFKKAIEASKMNNEEVNAAVVKSLADEAASSDDDDDE